jgi:hypothetical protein
MPPIYRLLNRNSWIEKLLRAVIYTLSKLLSYENSTLAFILALTAYVHLYKMSCLYDPQQTTWHFNYFTLDALRAIVLLGRGCIACVFLKTMIWGFCLKSFLVGFVDELPADELFEFSLRSRLCRLFVEFMDGGEDEDEDELFFQERGMGDDGPFGRAVGWGVRMMLRAME